MIMDNWLDRGLQILNQSLIGIPQELNNLDWKQSLPMNKDKLKKHIISFANHPGGGYFVFGIDDTNGKVVGFEEKGEVDEIVATIANFCRDSFDHPLVLHSATVDYAGREILIVFIEESSLKPVHTIGSEMSKTFIRTGGTTRPASESDLQRLLLNSKPHRYEEQHCTTLLRQNEINSHLDVLKLFKLLGIAVPQNSFTVTLFFPKDFSQFTGEEKMQACYQHCTLQYYNGSDLSNESLRTRFGLEKSQFAQVTKLIDKTIKAKLIKVKDETITSNKFIRYIPYWA